VSAPTGTGGGAADAAFYNIEANGSNVTGARPCVFSGAPAHTVGAMSLYAFSCLHAGSSQYELEINGNNAGSSGFNAVQFNFFGGHVETSNTASGLSSGIKIADASVVNFSGLNLSGPVPASSAYYNISETAAGNTADIHIQETFGSGSAGAYLVNNSASGGTNVRFTQCGAQPCAIVGEYSFKRPNAPQSVKGTTGCSTETTIGSQCSTAITVTWPTAFTDANYTPMCAAGGAPTHEPSAPFIASQTASAVTVNYYTLAASAAKWATIDCLAVHD